MLSPKVMEHVSKLLLLTSLGKKGTMKAKAVRAIGYMSSMTNKVREKFKL